MGKGLTLGGNFCHLIPLELASFGHFRNEDAQIRDEVGVTCLILHPWLEFGTLRLPVGARSRDHVAGKTA